MFNAEKTKNDCVNWIQNNYIENGLKGYNAVLGISGGKDSSVAAALCCEALGSDHVIGVLMPNGNQADIDMAHLLCDYLGIERYVVNIKDAISGVQNAVPFEMSKSSRNSIQPRMRMVTLYAVAGSIKGRVVNTCNLSENWVGYSTKYGDAAGDFAPLANLTVQEVIDIGRALALPSVLCEKTPSAGFYEGQTDEEDLGFTYAVLDRYIRTGEIDNPLIKEKIDERHFKYLHHLLSIPSFDPGIAIYAEN